MRVGIQARLKNGILWEAAKSLGSAVALAKHIGITQPMMNDWINFRRCPKFSHPRYRHAEKKLFDLTGYTFEEIFPPEIRGKAFQNRQKRIDAIVEMPVEVLAAAGAVPQLAPPPDEILMAEDRSRVIEYVVGSLNNPRFEKVVRMRFGLSPYDKEYRLDDIADELGVSRTRIGQIEAKALRMLRHPARSKQLEREVGRH